jgi:hypothetical protein
MATKKARGRSYSAKFPRGQIEARTAKTNLRRWQLRQPVPTAPKNPRFRIKAVRPSTRTLGKLRAVHASRTAKDVRDAQISRDAFLGTLYTALTVYEYTRLESEYKTRKQSGRRGVEAEWAAVQKAAQSAFAAGGLRTVAPDDLTRFSRILNANKANRDAVIAIANTGVTRGAPGRLAGSTIATATFVPTVARLIDDLPGLVIPIPTICSVPIAQGSFTRHFGGSVSLSVSITVWCPTWSNPFRTCTKTLTVAGVSWAVDVNVGYKVTCCGATAWGMGSASACATIIGISLCASCTASIVGVAGVSRTPVGTNCQYGLGISASLSCTLFGATIFSASAPFGWTISGPCPPAGACP